MKPHTVYLIYVVYDMAVTASGVAAILYATHRAFAKIKQMETEEKKAAVVK